MLSNTNPGSRFIFFIAIVAICFIVPAIVFYISYDLWLRVITFAVSILALFFGFRLASDTTVSDNKLRLTVLTSTTSLLFLYLQFRQKILWPFIAKFVPQAQTIPAWNEYSLDPVTIAVLILATVIAYLVLGSLRRSSPMGVPEARISEVLPQLSNPQRLKILKDALLRRLDRIDDETRWSDSNYVPLEAEVQILEGESTRGRLVDLLTALQRNQKAQIFVVLGEPGTGKSVAMRKLARDLLEGSKNSDRIAVYVNLREWRSEKIWTEKSPPTVQDFEVFLYNNLMQNYNLDSNSKAFLQDNYQRLLPAGYFFFIFDSFDEIPAVLDKDENSWLIKALSDCIVGYALSGLNSRAVLSSRLFRKPQLVNKKRTVYEIRPFSDDRIVRAISQSVNNHVALSRLVFGSRPDLGSIARNPFLLDLLINHFNQTGAAPANQADMFKTYIQSNIDLARRTHDLKEVSDPEIYEMCEYIALTMFNSHNIGLEIVDVDLKEKAQPIVSTVLRFLAQARVGRLNPITSVFSYSHRRFHEYFLVRVLSSRKQPIPFDAIQTDSRWRDALVLYAEVAPEADAKIIISHSWEYIGRLKTASISENADEFFEARNSLWFLVEGFRAKSALLYAYHAGLFDIVRTKIENDVDYIEKRVVVEAFALLPLSMSHELMLSVISRYPQWIGERAVSAARYLPHIDSELANAIFGFCTNRNGFAGVVEAIRQRRTFELSDAFKAVALRLKWFLADICKVSICTLLLFIGGVYHLTAEFFNSVIGITVFIVIAFIASAYRWIGLSITYRLAAKLLLASIFAIVVGEWVNDVVKARLASGAMTIVTIAKSLIANADPWIGGVTIVALVGLSSLDPVFWKEVTEGVSRVWANPRKVLESLLPRRSFVVFVTWMIGALGVSVYGKDIDYVINYLWSFVPETIKAIVEVLGRGFIWLAGAVLAIASLAGVIAVIAFIGRFLLDLRNLYRCKRSFNPNRIDIARQFESFYTKTGRTWYVDWLESASIDHFDILRQHNNRWPPEGRPQLSGDEASLRLARLDARWLGLD